MDREGAREGPAGKRPDRNIARQHFVQFAKSFSIIDADFKSEPAIIDRIGELIDQMPDHTLSGLIARMELWATPQSIVMDDFCATYHISPAEARLLAALVNGGRIATHAESEGISINTARTHMRRLLEKTGSSGQVDLVRRFFSA